MTYFGFLGIFLLIPVGLLIILILWDRNQGREIPTALRAWPPAAAIILHVVIAVLYTTIWDNYLVATRVWWYDPALVTGVTIAYVPIEEYTFFILQPILAGLWLLFLLRRIRLPDVRPQELLSRRITLLHADQYPGDIRHRTRPGAGQSRTNPRTEE